MFKKWRKTAELMLDGVFLFWATFFRHKLHCPRMYHFKSMLWKSMKISLSTNKHIRKMESIYENREYFVRFLYPILYTLCTVHTCCMLKKVLNTNLFFFVGMWNNCIEREICMKSEKFSKETHIHTRFFLLVWFWLFLNITSASTPIVIHLYWNGEI